jgi:hypothetical protein
MEEITIRFDDPVFYCAECHQKTEPKYGMMFTNTNQKNGQFEFLCCRCVRQIIEMMEEAFE